MQFAELVEQLPSEAQIGGTLVLQAVQDVPLVIPGDAWLLKADFTPQGADLLLTGPDGAQVLIRDFFNLENPPDLLTDSGAMIAADLAHKLAGPMAPGQFALLENGPFSELAQAAESIGRVEATDGLVEAIRIDGTKVTLAKGDDIFQGDTLLTAKGAAVGITFIDDTTFSLGEEGRMVIDEMVYDPGTQEGQFSANLVQGVFSFVSGQIAKTSPEGMTVSTPVATIGIRGTKVAGRAAQEGAQNTISLLPETDAQGNQSVGQLSVTNQAGTVTLSTVGATVQMTSAFTAPPPPVIFSPQQIQQNFGSTLTTLSTTVAAKATNDAAENAQEAEQAQAEAEQAGAEAEAAAAEAEAAQAEAEAAQAEAEASGDAEAIAAAEAATAEAEAKAAEAETAAAEAEAAAAEAEAAQAEAETAQAEAEHANNEMQAQAEAFATFGGQPGDAPPEGEAPAEGEGPPEGAADGDAPPEGDQQAGEGEAPPEGEHPEGEDAVFDAAEEAAREAIEAGASPEEVFAAAAAAAAEQLAAEGDSPEDIAEETAAAEEAFKAAIASGASPEEAMALAMQAAENVFGDENGGFDDGGGGFDDGGGGFDDGGFGGGGFFGGGGGFFGGGGGGLFDGGGGIFDDGGGFFDDGGGGFFDENLFGGGGEDFFGDFFEDTFDPLLGDIFDLGNVFDVIDHTDEQFTQPVASQETFTELRSGTVNSDDGSSFPALVGTSANTNFYFSYSAIGGSDIVTGGGGTNQISFDELNDVVLKFTIDGSVATTGAVDIQLGNITGTNPGAYALSSYSGATSSSIDFTGIGQYLFADQESALSGAYTAHSEENQSETPTEADSGDIIVMPSLEAGDVGYVIAGGAGIDTITLDDYNMDGVIVFGKGGGDIFNISAQMDALLIGGITGTDNTAPNSAGIPTANLNVFDYSTLRDASNFATLATSATGLNASIFSFLDEGSYETTALVNYVESSITSMNNNLWDVGSFTGSAGADSISLFGARLNTLDTGSGNDNVVVDSTSRVLSLTSGGGTNNYLTLGSDSTEGDMNLSGTSIAAFANISLNNSNVSTSGTTTLTMDSSTNFQDTLAIVFGTNTNHAHIESTNGLSLYNTSSVSYAGSGGLAILLDSDWTSGSTSTTLTLSSGPTWSIGSTFQIRGVESTGTTAGLGANSYIITSTVGMDLSSALMSGIANVNFNTTSGTYNLTVNSTTDFTSDSTSTNNVIINGTGGTSTITSDDGMNLTDVTLLNVDTVILDSGSDTGAAVLTIDTGTNLSTATITGSGDEKIVFNETGTYSIANNTTSGIATVQFAGTGTNSLELNQSNNATIANITGNSGSDTITTAETTLNLSGSTLTSIDNITTTNTSGTTFTGTSGADTITGFTGTDILIGGAEADALTGGSGVDTFTYTTVTDSTFGSLDTILDFVAGGSGDKIDTNIVGTLAVLGNISTDGYNLADLNLTVLNTLFNSTNGTNGTTLSGSSDNTDVFHLGTDDSKTVWAIDVDGNGVFDALDTIIDMTGVTGSADAADFV